METIHYHFIAIKLAISQYYLYTFTIVISSTDMTGQGNNYFHKKQHKDYLPSIEYLEHSEYRDFVLNTATQVCTSSRRYSELFHLQEVSIFAALYWPKNHL